MGDAPKTLPKTGYAADDVLGVLRALRADDADWKGGRVWALVYHAGDELHEFLEQAYTTYFSENALNPGAFPSIKRMENEVVAMVGQLLGGDDQVVGNMTSGGTESILMAVKTARDHARAHRPRLRHPEMVLPASAHPAFDKAAHYFGVKAVRVKVGDDGRACVRRMRRAINRRTVLLVGSAPSYPHGLLDPIEDIARLARRRRLLCHVDACVGGMMLPFVRQLGYPVAPFDLSVPGVTSLSVDLHKYGYCAKPASLILHRTPELRRHQYFATTDWSGGIYVSPTMTGSRPGAAVAAAWAMLHHLGVEGYLEIARAVMRTARDLRDGIESIDGLRVQGEPVMCILAIASDEVDVYEIGDGLQQRGWTIDRQQFPPTLHLTVNAAHVHSVDAFLADLRAATDEARSEPMDRLLERGKFALLNATVRLLPSRLVSKITDVASSKMGMSSDGVPKRSAPMYGMMANLPNRGDLRKIVVDTFDQMTRYEAASRIPLPGDDADR